MPRKYSFYQLVMAHKQHMVASIYTEPDDPDAYNAGYIEAVTPRHVLLWNVTPWGHTDGWLLRRTEDVLQVFMGDDYEVRLQMLLEMNGSLYEPLLTPEPTEEDDLQRLMLQKAQAMGAVVSLLTAEDTLTGRVCHLDDLRVTLDAFDFFGTLEAKKSLPLREITVIAMDTQEEKMFEKLNAERLRVL